jgi:3-carboxy-cis,cis-muconate cycloisomerase
VTAFDALFVPDELREAVSGAAWLQALLDAERALARAEAAAGLVPAEAAEAIAAACSPDGLDWELLLERGRAAGNPVEPLVRELRARVGDHERWVHHGATSQDILDTGAMLVARHALALVDADLDRAAAACAVLAGAHRSTTMAARTLLQQAVPTTFGLVCAGWLTGVLDARRALIDVSRDGLAVQLGGAAGTLAVLGDQGPTVVELFARELGLSSPPLPWHTNRVRVAELGGALAVAAGACGKIGLDLALLAQNEVAEVRLAAAGGSSTMPQKRNPVAPALARACAAQAAAQAGVLVASLQQEHQRAAGAWHAEWPALESALAFAGGAAAAVAGALETLEVDATRMQANLDASGGAVVAERVAVTLAESIGRGEAHEVVAAAAASPSLREALLADERVTLEAAELDALLDPAGYVGAAEELVDRALARYAEVADG